MEDLKIKKEDKKVILELASPISYLFLLFLMFFGLFHSLKKTKGGKEVFCWIVLSSVCVFILSCALLMGLRDVLIYDRVNAYLVLITFTIMTWCFGCRTMIAIVSTFGRNKK